MSAAVGAKPKCSGSPVGLPSASVAADWSIFWLAKTIQDAVDGY